MSELSDAEREAMEKAKRPQFHGTGRDRIGIAPTFEQGWLTARDYYKAEQQAEQGRLEEMVQEPPIGP